MVINTFTIQEHYATDIEILDSGNNLLLEYWTDEGKQYVYTFVPEGSRVRVELRVNRLPQEEGEGHGPVIVSETKDLARDLPKNRKKAKNAKRSVK